MKLHERLGTLTEVSCLARCYRWPLQARTHGRQASSLLTQGLPSRNMGTAPALQFYIDPGTHQLSTAATHAYGTPDSATRLPLRRGPLHYTCVRPVPAFRSAHVRHATRLRRVRHVLVN